MTRKSAIKFVLIFMIISAIVFVGVYYFNNKQITFESALNDVQKGDFESALSKFLVLAMEDNVHAQINLGMLYENGRGVAVNNQKAYVGINLPTHAQQG
jgi:TPR repeat protein